jgi:tRNA threonylcarbamoyladenosine biosynthesis protein TsaE
VPKLQISSASPEETEQLGATIGSLLQTGFFLALRGGLGGGKTCLTRGLVAALAPQSSQLVASPTYAIMNSYPGTIPVYHFDFYRLSGDDDIAELGFEEYFYGDGVSIVEWSERLTDLLPPDVLTLQFEYAGDKRRMITVYSSGIKSDMVIEQLSSKLLQQKKL